MSTLYNHRQNVIRVQQLYKLDLALDQLTMDHLANYHGFLQRCKHASTFHEYHLEDCAKEKEDEDGMAIEFLLCCASNRSTVWVYPRTRRASDCRSKHLHSPFVLLSFL